jgi:hypothetical protein
MGAPLMKTDPAERNRHITPLADVWYSRSVTLPRRLLPTHRLQIDDRAQIKPLPSALLTRRKSSGIS